MTFDGIPAPLIYVQSNQVNAVVPWELGGSGVTQMCETWQTTSCTTVALGAAAPGLFAVSPWPTGYGAIPMAAAVNQDGTINSPQNPAHVGSALALFLTGLRTAYANASGREPDSIPATLSRLYRPDFRYAASLCRRMG